MSATWLLIADQRRGRLFEVNSTLQSFVEVESFENAAGRPGVRSTNQASDPPTALGDPDTPASDAAGAFAAALVAILEQARAAGRFDSLITVAPSGFAAELDVRWSESMRGHVRSPDDDFASLDVLLT